MICVLTSVVSDWVLSHYNPLENGTSYGQVFVPSYNPVENGTSYGQVFVPNYNPVENGTSYGQVFVPSYNDNPVENGTCAKYRKSWTADRYLLGIFLIRSLQIQSRG